ncbi:hypothetical protein B0H11DRAFT_1885146 [Mycena galericulata]|nr:hypothetical protein B0H11DRAFT_1885146 [Mycena galericulata]
MIFLLGHGTHLFGALLGPRTLNLANELPLLLNPSQIYPAPVFTDMSVADLSPAAARDRLDELDAEISALETSLVPRKLERESLAAHLDAYTYPVLTLPNEIVSEIFLQHLHPLATCTSVSPSSRNSPLFLGHICRKWREIALSTPWLWTVINLHLGDVATHQRQIHLLEVWLTRSRSCPLSISFYYKLPFAYVDAPHHSVKEFLKHSYRIAGGGNICS